MPLMHIYILEGRSDEKKAQLIKEVTRVASETLEVPADRVRVVLQEVPKNHWGIGGETAASLGR
ncbi:4-oxalocrotonate tautomerase [Beggiatoa leptomitoformis]|uniref:Tautomerase n=1 Tax=Beggiatoa leptomitoformis TaxID=288004 RepID=A0A2N9YC83_9GAMM|nr:4-oxalocrotonate tautomerase [Beggiatoa leptomitoformis]ALG66612.1 4-oxalocrotonate tautomerase [Beggiatoa leptomitoformis]AUI68077.1 4-oxalocrotonate tautomerase [Beggiatoa leptomitoformis]